MIHWLYTAIIRPNISYEFNIMVSIIKVQWVAELSILPIDAYYRNFELRMISKENPIWYIGVFRSNDTEDIVL